MFFILFLLFIPNCSSNSEKQINNREILEKQYPGYGKTWITIPGDNNTIINGSLVYPESSLNKMFSILIKPRDVMNFTLYNRGHLKEGLISRTTIDLKFFDKNLPVIFIIHGWQSSDHGKHILSLKDAILKDGNVNVFIVDWSVISKDIFYPSAASQTYNVGQYIGEFLNNLTKQGADPKLFHLVGHSLGAHVSRYAGLFMKENMKIGRITGLDPALPGFDLAKLNKFKDSAEFTDIVHTSGGFLGIKQPIGHSDFFPNGGTSPQPGCNISGLIEGCSHNQSWKYYTSSVLHPEKFLAKRCKTYADYKKNNCDKKAIVGYHISPFTIGSYYLDVLNV